MVFLGSRSPEARMKKSASVLFTLVALSAGLIVSAQSGDARKPYQSQILKVTTPSQVDVSQNASVIPHAVLLAAGASAGGNPTSQSVTVSLQPGSSALIMCIYANSTGAQSAVPSCGITSPSFQGATLPDVHKVPGTSRTVLIESKSGQITLGCNGQAPVSCEAMVYW